MTRPAQSSLDINVRTVVEISCNEYEVLEVNPMCPANLQGPQGVQGLVGPPGPQGDPGPSGQAGSDLNYLHNQGVADTVWNITHNLGKYPSVTVQDSSGREIQVDILELTATTAKLGLSYPTSGKAFLN